MEERISKRRQDLLSQFQAVAGAMEEAILGAREAPPKGKNKEELLDRAASALVNLVLDRGEVVLRFTEAWPLLEARTGAFPIPKHALTRVCRRAFQEGLRALRFHSFLNPQEARKLLEILARTPAGGTDTGGRGEPDLTTQLWEADLRTVTLEAVGDPRISSFPGLETGGGGRIPFPTFGGKDKVRKEIRTPLLLRTGIFLVRALAEDPGRRARVAPLFRQVLEGLVRRGDLAGAVELFRFIERTREITEAGLKSLHQALDPFRNRKWVDSVVPILESLGDPATVGDFFFLLGPPLVPRLLEALRKPESSESLFDVLSHMARRDPRPFREWLKTAPPPGQMDILRILAEAGDPGMASLAKGLLESPQPQIRALTLKALAHAPIEEIRPFLWKCLMDRSVPVRVLGLKILAAKGGKEDLAPLERIIQGRAFFRREVQEKQTALEALARIQGEDALETLRELLGSRARPGEDRAWEEIRCAAARALQWVPGEGARALLIEASRSESPALREASLAALRAFVKGRPEDSPTPPRGTPREETPGKVPPKAKTRG